MDLGQGRLGELGRRAKVDDSDLQRLNALSELCGDRRALRVLPRYGGSAIDERGAVLRAAREGDEGGDGRVEVGAACAQLNPLPVPTGFCPFERRIGLLVTSANWSVAAWGAGKTSPRNFELGVVFESEWTDLEALSEPFDPPDTIPFCVDRADDEQPPLSPTAQQVQLGVTPARVTVAMLLGEPCLDRKALELHTVALQRLAGGSGERPTRRRGPWVLLRDPLEVDFAGDDSHVGAPRRQSSIFPLADGRSEHVKLGRLELLELSSGAPLTGDARDERDVRRALHAAEQRDEALDSRCRDLPCGGAE
ncbi:MAG: hypothetical protein EOP08_01105 [Proteobacteria bacterium]|nr:MAG: hypothetical protein EOP08_01105 [Pseudomonadota bacterium]